MTEPPPPTDPRSATPAGDLPWSELGRWLAGEMSTGESEAMARWVAADPSRAELIALLREAWSAAGAAGEGWDARAAIRRVREAAGGEARVIARLGGGAALTRPRHGWLSLAVGLRVAAVLAAVAGASLLTERKPRSAPPPAAAAVAEYRTAPGQRLVLRLADGTEVMLAPGSVLRRPADYGVRQRRLELEGEAYFTVAHDAALPFTVHTRHLVARDLGTRFDVRAYPGDSLTDVIVAEGEVKLVAEVTLEGGPAARLHAGQLARADARGRVTVREKVDLDRYLAWTEGRLVFRDTPLGAVAEQLERWYDVEVRLGAGRLDRLRVTGAFGDEPVTEVLGAVARSLGLEVRRAGRRYLLLQSPT